MPLAGFPAALALLWNQLVGWTDVTVLATMYLVVGLGVTVGFHRLLTHRSFVTHRAIAYALAALARCRFRGR